MSNKELAEKLGYSVANIKAILHRLKLRRSKRKYRDKYDRIMLIAKKHGCKRTTDLIDIFGFEKWKEIYVVVAYRWGYRENHSYTLGVFDDKNEAIKCAESHAEHRGGKYACAVEKCVMNEFENDADYYTNEVYRAKSAMCSASHKI